MYKCVILFLAIKLIYNLRFIAIPYISFLFFDFKFQFCPWISWMTWPKSNYSFANSPPSHALPKYIKILFFLPPNQKCLLSFVFFHGVKLTWFNFYGPTNLHIFSFLYLTAPYKMVANFFHSLILIFRIPKITKNVLLHFAVHIFPHFLVIFLWICQNLGSINGNWKFGRKTSANSNWSKFWGKININLLKIFNIELFRKLWP